MKAVAESAAAEAAAAVSQLMVPAVALGLLMLVVAVGGYVWLALALSRVFSKRGVEAWRAWVPVLNAAEILRLGRISPWLIVLCFIPVLDLCGLVLLIVAMHRVNRGFSRGAGVTVLAVLLPPVWASILAWGRETSPGSNASFVPMPADAVPGRSGTGQLETGWLGTGQLEAGQFGTDRSVPGPLGAPAAPSWAPPRLMTPSNVPGAGATPGASARDVVWRPAPSPQDAAAPWSPPAAVPPAPPAAAPTQPPPTAGPTPTPPAAAMPEAGIGISAELEETVQRPAAGNAPAELPTDTGTVVVPRPATVVVPDDDKTVVVVRRRPRWNLATDTGDVHELTCARVIVGRHPSGHERGVQYLALDDGTRTLSKQHASFALDGDAWTVADLASTNGTVIVDTAGVEHPLVVGVPGRVEGRVLLGELGVMLERVGR